MRARPDEQGARRGGRPGGVGTRRVWTVLALTLLGLLGYGAVLRAAPVPAPAAPSSLLGSGPASTSTAGPTPVPTGGLVAAGPSGAAAPLPFAGPERGEVQAALDAHAVTLAASPALAQLPLAALSYSLGDIDGDDDAVRVTATMSYRLRAEVASVQVPVRVDLVRGRAGWRVQDEQPTTRPLLWDVGRLTVARVARTTVIGVGEVAGGREALRWWAEAGDRAVQDVRARVGGWDGRLTLVLPPDAATLARLTGRSTASVTSLAALALAEPVAAGDRPVVRVYLNQSLLGAASPLARQIVLRHEATHVALRAPATAATPVWLEEGVAEYLGYQGSGVPPAVAVRDLLARLRTGQFPDRPPAAGDFGGPHVEVAYQAAHVLVDTMVDQVGLAGTLRVYRLTAADSELATAWRTVSGTSWQRLLARWQADLRTRADG